MRVAHPSRLGLPSFGQASRGAMARFSLIPREEKFFAEFVGLAEEIRGGSKLLKQMLSANPPDAAKADAIKDIEHRCDGRTRAIIDRLNRTFVTPLDREDIHTLAISLDDVMDAIDAAAAVVRLYKITHVRPGAKRLAELVCESMDLVTQALELLDKRQGVLELAARVNQLEREADRVHQDAIVALFDEERDPIAVIKWKEIFDFLEAATDRTEDVGNLLEGVVVKHG
jgi:predicted phosphate transport protein (TIGR00153 family)